MPNSDRDSGVNAPRSYLRIQAIGVPVRDLDRSLAFYGETLGFRIIHPPLLPAGMKLAFVAPPDGAAVLVLAESEPASGPRGTPSVAFITDDLDRRYREWSERGVHFSQPPRSVPWSARQAVFQDPDGNAFSLIQSDVVSQQL